MVTGTPIDLIIMMYICVYMGDIYKTASITCDWLQGVLEQLSQMLK